MRRVVGFLVLFVLSGCAQSQLEHQTGSFNRATANAIGEQTLLNAVRSSLDMPMSFTKLLKFTASNMASGSLAPKLPFGADAAKIFDFGPSVSLHSGVGEIEYADANNSGALAKLNKNLQYDTIDRYLYEGLDATLLDTILVEYLEIHGKLWKAIAEEAKQKCRNPSELEKIVCDEITQLRECKGSFQVFKIEDDAMNTLTNRARSRCEFQTYQLFRFLFALAGHQSELGFENGKKGTTSPVGKSPVSKNGVSVTVTNVLPDGSKASAAKEMPKQVIAFSSPKVQRVFEELERKFRKEAQRRDQKQRQSLRYVLRSPKSLLTYLGELIALQNFSEDRYVPEIMVVGRQQGRIVVSRMTMFHVIRGQPLGTKVAISTQGPDGEKYSVPAPQYGSNVRDQTLRVLAIAGELVNGALSDKDFPAPASVIVRGIQ
jgi:hypothetical protein